MWSSGRKWTTFAVLAVLTAVAFGVWGWFQNRPATVFLQAIAAVENSDFRRVSAAATRLEQFPEFRPHAHLLRGCSLLNSGDAPGALREFSRARPEGILRFPLLQFTAQALYSTGQSFEAAQLLIVLVSENPESAEAHRWLGAIYYDLGNLSAALAELKEAVRLNPLDHRPHRLMGVICTDESQFDAAIEHYRSALRLGQDIAQPDIQADLALVFMNRNRFAEALEVLASAEQTASVWALRAECYDGLGEQDASRDAVDNAIKADPENARALLLYGTRQLSDGKALNAIEPLQKVLLQDPHDTKARYQLAMAYSKLGQTEAWQREMDARDASNKLHEQFYALVKQAAVEPANFTIREEIAAMAATLGKRELARRWELAAAVSRAAVESDSSGIDENIDPMEKPGLLEKPGF